MKKLLSYFSWVFLWVPLALIAVVFLVSNRQLVAVSMNPFADSTDLFTSPALPLWLWLMMMLFVGFGLGILGMWSSSAPRRRKTRALQREVKELKLALAVHKEARANPESLPVLKAE